MQSEVPISDGIRNSLKITTKSKIHSTKIENLEKCSQTTKTSQRCGHFAPKIITNGSGSSENEKKEVRN